MRHQFSKAGDQPGPACSGKNLAARPGRQVRICGLSALSILGLGGLFWSTPSPLPAQGKPTLPQGGIFVGGAGSIGAASNGSLTVSQSSARGVVDWNSFSIGAGGRVLINNGAGATLSRVTGSGLTQIEGLLKATGSLYLINRNGVVIGAKGCVLTDGSFVASTRDIATAAFMAGGPLTASGTSAGAVTNEGSIVARDGDVVLIGRSVDNSGLIKAPNGTATLASGNDILLTTVGGPAGVYVAPETKDAGQLTQSGRIEAAAAALKAGGGDIYTLAGNRTGLISATGTKTVNGEVWLSAPNGKLVAGGDISARNADGTGGRVVANGADVAIPGSARISAQGSSGGTVLVGVSSPGGTDLSNSTTVADGASVKAGGAAGGGLVETSGHAVSIGKASIEAGPKGLWRVDPIDLTIDASAATTIASSLDSGTNVTDQTTATTASGAGNQGAGNGDINVAAPITWAGTGALTLSAYHDLNLNAAISGGGGFTGTAGGAVAVSGNVSASSVLMTAAGGDLTLAPGVTLTGASGITLQTAGRFINNAGPGALTTGGGQWLVYSADPSGDTTGGLTPSFLQYGASAATTPAISGNGLLYSVSPSLTVGLSGTVEKTYDGNTNASFTGANAAVTGLINSDTAAVTGAYAGKNAGNAISVTASIVAVTHAGIPVFGYAGTTPSVSANIGQIDPASLTASIVGNPTKTYNATTTATLGSSNYQLTGFVAGEGATVNQPSSVAYDSSDAGARSISATFGRTNFVPTGGTSLSNYTLPTTATGPGTINQAPLLISGVLATDKTYDRTAADTLNTSAASLYGIIGSDDVSLVKNGAAGTFSAASVGSNLPVTASGFSLSGAKAGDYALAQPSGLMASISAAQLTISGVSVLNKVYDGTSAAALNTSGESLNGLIPGDTVTLGGTTAANFATPDAGSGIAVTASGFSILGGAASNYRLSQPSGLSANITARPLSVAVTATPTKIYNGDAGATVDSSGFSLTGFVPGQSATVTQTSQLSYASPNAGAQTVTASLAVSDYTPGSGTKLSNYGLPTFAAGIGTITPAPITISIDGNPTKTYDATPSATLNSSNYQLSGFLTGQSATVTKTSGLYDSANVGGRQVTATLGSQDLTPGSGTILSNYAFPTTVTGFGTIFAAPLAGSIYAGITGNPTKSYDGTTTATLNSSNFLLSGFFNNDGATVTQTAGTYASKNAGVQGVTASLTASDFSPVNGTNLSNYTLPTIAYGSGTITPAVLSAAIVGTPTKVYNSTSNASLTNANFRLTGLAPTEGLNIGNSVQASYDARQAGSRTVTASIATTDITPQGGTLLSNYVLPASATGPGLITQAPLSILDVVANNRTYDTTTVGTLSTGGAHLFGVVGSDNVVLSSAGSTAAFNSPSAGSNVPVTASGFSISGSDVANYQLSQPSGLFATIYRAPLSITGVSANSKNYDNTNVATLSSGSASLSGVFSADNGQVGLDATNATATFSAVNVGNNLPVSGGGFALTGGQASNYALNQPSGLAANINPAPLTANIIGNPTKVYDGSPSTTLTAANYQLTGFVAGQGASVPQSATASYLSPDAGTQGIGSTLASSDFSANSGTNLSNYVLPTTGSGTGTITKAPLTAAIINNPTKSYDSTTAATLSASDYSLGGFISGQGATVTKTAGVYDTANAGTRSVTAALIAGDYTASNGGTNLNNYALPTSATGTGTINRAPLQVVNVLGTSRTYDGTTNDSLNVATANVSGLFGSDTVTLNSGSAIGAFASKDAGNGIGVTATGFSISGGQAANYNLSQPTGLSADITRALLNLTNVTRVYDSTSGLPTSSSAYTLSGLFGSDTATVDPSGISGSFADKNVGTGKGVSVSGLALTGNPRNYTINPSLTNANIGTITPAALTVAGVGAADKMYDGTTSATLTGTAALSGLFGGDAVTLDTTGATATFSDKNVAPGKTVTATNYAVSGGDTGNYTFTQPTGITASITPNNGINLTSVTKIYDGGASLPTASAAYGLSGILGADVVLVNTGSGLSGSYGSSNVGSNLSVSLSGLTLTGPDAQNYSIGSTISSQNIGTINPKTLSAAIIGTPTKTYDTTAAATLASGNYSISGFVSGEGTTVTKTSGTYSSPNAGTPSVSTSLAGADFTGTGQTLLTNYILPTTASGAGQINKAPLTITGVYAVDKTSDGNTTGTLNTASATLYGAITPDLGSVSLNKASAAGLFDSKNVGPESVTASNFSIFGGQSTNYSLSQPAGLSANITEALLNLTQVTKQYDSTTGLPGTSSAYTLSGIVGADAVSIDTSGLNGIGLNGSYADKNVGTSKTMNLSGISLTGAQAGNYSISSSLTNANIGKITTAPLTILGTQAVGKVYDGTTTATLDNTSSHLSGLLGTDSVSLTSPTSGTFASPNAGAWAVTPGSFYTISGSDAGNYSLSQPTAPTAAISKASLSASITGTPSKTYDGTSTAALTSGNYALSGFVGTQSATVNQTLGTYASPNAGSPTVSATLSAGNFAQGSGTLLSNYNLPTSASGSGLINVKTLTASIIGNPNKTYDGTTAATLTPSNYSISGFVAGQGATVAQTSGTYAGANAGSETVSAFLSAGNFTATGGANFANYVLPTAASGSGTINVKVLSAAITGNPTKIYDGGVGAVVASSDYTLSGFISGESATVNQSAGSYSNSNVGSRTVNATLSGGNFTQGSGTTLSNYSLPTSASGTGTINPKQLTAVITNNPSKTYDNTTNATLTAGNYLMGGFVGAQSATVTQTLGTYDDPNAGSRGVSAALSGGNFTPGGGTTLSNYILPTSASGSGTINPKGLSAIITGDPSKTYDGGIGATLGSGDYTLTGFVGAQSATVTQTAGTYDLADAGSRTVMTTLASGDFNQANGTNLANYTLPTSASGLGLINQKHLTAGITGAPTKTYDGGVGATLTPGDYTLTGFVGAQSAEVTQTAGSYDTADAGSRTVTTTLAAGNFSQANGTNLANYTLPTSASGPGLINQKQLTAAITGNPTKTYDGGTTAILNSIDYTLSGFVGAQSATVTQTAGTYDFADAGSRTVTTTLASGNFSQANGTNLANYTLPASASGTGTINQKPLTAAITGNPTKTYDGGTAAALSGSDYSLTGFVSGQGAKVGQTAGGYDSADAGSRTVATILVTGDFIQNSGTNLTNYILPTAASGAGLINQRQLTATVTGTPMKTYDGGTAAALVPSDFTLSGFVNGQGATVTQSSGTYDIADAGSRTVTANLGSGDLTQNSGTNLANYILPTTASGASVINPKALLAAVTGNPSKPYDGGNLATFASNDYTLSGFVAGQGATVTQTAGTYDAPDAGSRIVTANLGSGDISQNSGTNLANYVLPTTVSGPGMINPKALSATIVNASKTYDGSTAATLAPGNFVISGFAPGQGATVTQASGAYDTADAGVRNVTAFLSTGDLTLMGGTNAANYILPTAASGVGQIFAKPLSIAITGSPTKTYDGTTAAVLSSGDYTVSGFVAGQSAAVNQTLGNYDLADAGQRTVTTFLAAANFNAGSGTNLSNYVLLTLANGSGSVAARPLSALIICSSNQDEGRNDCGDSHGGQFCNDWLCHGPKCNHYPALWKL